MGSKYSPKKIDVIIYGPGCKTHMAAKMQRQFSNREVQLAATLFYYPINLSLRAG